MESKLKRVIVTGGAGFLGSHLCEYLLQSGMEVLCIDNLSSGSMQNMDAFAYHSRFRFIKHDVTLPLPEFTDIAHIYNLACPASPRQYQKDPIQTLKTSVYGAVNMLEICRKLSCDILHTSTSEIYGNPAVHPQTEDYVGHVNPVGLRACYDEGKRAAEALCFDYQRCHAVQIHVARLFNSYGPRMQMNDGRVMPNFIVQALLNKPITLHGDGLQTRSFCYVTDTIAGLLRLMAKENFAGPVNIGNPEEISMLALAELIIEMTGSRSALVFNPAVPDDPERRKPDISLANTIIHWRPVVSLREGLKHTIAYFDSVLSHSRVSHLRAISSG